MRRFAPACALLAISCTPALPVVVHADTPETADRLLEGVRDAEIALEGRVWLEPRVVWVDEQESHKGSPYHLERLATPGAISLWPMHSIEQPGGGPAHGVAHMGEDQCSPVIGAIPGKFNERLAAHEFGHIFGLGHEDAESNVMSTRPLSGSGFEPWQLEFAADNIDWYSRGCGFGQ